MLRPRGGSSGFRTLRLEGLETRNLLTAAPLIGPVSPGLSDLASSPVSPPAATPLTPAQVAEETAVAQSINAFGLELYSALQSQAGGSGNTLFSPISISAALAMAYAGANGQTATQMASVLHFAGDSDAVEQEFGTLLSDLNSAGQGPDYTLSVANALWGQQGMTILAPFLQTMQADFNGGLKQVDFKDDPGAAVQTINDWVSQQTAGKIQQLVSSGDVSQLTRLVLTNAVYFNGTWATAFDAKATQNAPFTLDSGDQVQVPLMHSTSGYGYMDSDGFQVVDLPYAGGRFSMDILLPNQGYSAAGLNVGQLPANLTSWLSGLQNQQVAVSLPKFDLNTQFELGNPLQSLGMTDAFSNSADFSGITNPSVAMLKISAVVHKATISVDETGTVATAATGIGFVQLSIVSIPPPPIVFDADHPFLFLIRDDQSGSVLFMGQEMDPTSTTGDPSAPPIGAAPPPSAAPPIPIGPPGSVMIGHLLIPIPTSPPESQRDRFELSLASQETGGTGTPPTSPTPTSGTGTNPPGSTTSPPTTGTPGTGSGSTGSGSTGTSTTRAHGSHQFAATDAAVSDFDLADLNALNESPA